MFSAGGVPARGKKTRSSAQRLAATADEFGRVPAGIRGTRSRHLGMDGHPGQHDDQGRDPDGLVGDLAVPARDRRRRRDLHLAAGRDRRTRQGHMARATAEPHRGRRRPGRNRAGFGEDEPEQLGLGSHIASASFMVAPPYAGRGSGRALGEQALRWARVEGYRGMRFNAVVETNTASVRLGKSLGFEILGHAQGISAPDPRLRQAAHHAPPALTADLVGTWPAGAGRRSLSPHSGCEYPVRQPVDERSSSPGRSVRP